MTTLASPLRQLMKGADVKQQPTLEERFWARVTVRGPDDCWEWHGPTFRRGYGMFSISRRHNTGAHRMAWTLTNGPIPGELCVLHRCDNPPCCNPAHLFLGDRGDNARDMVRKGRQWMQKDSSRFRRAGNGRAKLTDEQVDELRRRYAAGETQTALAREFPVSRSAIGYVVRGEHWV